MSIVGLGSPTANLYSQLADVKTSNQTTPSKMEERKATTDGSIVSLSNSGKQAITEELSFKDIGSSAREKLDILRKQAAEKTKGSANTVDIQKVDYSSFSDQELAAMAQNSSKNFTEEEQIHAQGWLNERVRVALEPYRAATNAGDRRGHAMAINVLYDKMSPEVRSALGWTPTMMAANNAMLNGDEERFGKLEFAKIFSQLQSAAANGGISLNAS